MLKIIQRSLIFLCLFLLASCNSSDSTAKKRSAQSFIDTIESVLDSFASTSENFAAYLAFVVPIAEHDPAYKLDKNKIDSLKNYYNTYMNSLTEGISKLSNLNEFDTSLKQIPPILHFLKKTKDAYSSTFPSWFKIYHVGWDEASDADKQIMEETPKILREANSSSAKELKNIGTTIHEFKRKYALILK